MLVSYYVMKLQNFLSFFQKVEMNRKIDDINIEVRKQIELKLMWYESKEYQIR